MRNVSSEEKRGTIGKRGNQRPISDRKHTLQVESRMSDSRSYSKEVGRVFGRIEDWKRQSVGGLHRKKMRVLHNQEEAK